MSIQREIAEVVKAINWKGRFIGLTYRTKSTGELARYVLQVGGSYLGTLEKSLSELNALNPPQTDLEKQAREAVQASILKSIEAAKRGEQSEDYTKKGQYVQVPGTPLQVSMEDGTFEIKGIVISKTVLEPGIYKKVNSRPLTLAKDAIEKQLTKGKFRTFALDKEAFESARICGEEITV